MRPSSLTLFVVFLGCAAAAMVLWDSRNASSLAVLLLALATYLLGFAFYSDRADKRAAALLTQFPGPIKLAAPAWQRVLRCLGGMALAGVFYRATVEGARIDDREILGRSLGVLFSLLLTLAALLQLFRQELILRVDTLEYRSLRRKYSYDWSQLSRFYIAGQTWGRYVFCEFTNQSQRNWLIRRGLGIIMPLGISKYALVTLLTDWRALAVAGSQMAAPDGLSHKVSPHGRSLLDYAPTS